MFLKSEFFLLFLSIYLLIVSVVWNKKWSSSFLCSNTILGLSISIALFFINFDNIPYSFTENLLKSLFILVGILTCFIGYKNGQRHEFYSLICASLSILCFLISSINLLYIFLFFSIQSIITIILICGKKSEFFRSSVEGSLKFYLLSCFSSMMFFFGSCIIFGVTGFFNLSEIRLFLMDFDVFDTELRFNIILGCIFIFTGLLIKIYCAPFNGWISDVYNGTPFSFLFYFSTVPYLTNLIIFYKLYFIVFVKVVSNFSTIFTILGLLGLLFGTIGAINSSRIKEFIGYTTVTTSGLFVFANSMHLIPILVYAFFYVAAYIMFSILLLCFLAFFKDRFRSFEKISDLFKLYYVNKFLGIIVVFKLFMFLGLPPFLMFLVKFNFLINLFHINPILGFIFVAYFICSSFYYMKFIKSIFDEYFKNQTEYFSISKIDSYVIYIYLIIFFISIIFILNYHYLLAFIKLYLFYTSIAI